ncbi:MAG: M1 family metallopeptidase [Bacteroidota bacterium]
MLRTLVLLLLITISKTALSQPDYWQQKIKYEMDIDVDVDNYKYTGKSKICYYNNSPDTLRKVYFHLYFNAFQPGSEMDVRQQNLPDPDRRIGSRISKLKEDEIGYQKIISIKQGNVPLANKIEGTLMEVKLNKPILPGSKTILFIENEAQVPVQIRRSGRDNSENIKLSMAQWYPKMAEYDREGWHLDAYISREFYGVYGTFDVKISIDKNYTIGSTGVLQNPKNIGHGYQKRGSKTDIGKSKKLQWHFKAKNVHDFAWAADDNYQHDIRELNNGTKLHFFFKKGDKQRTANWRKMQDKMITAFTFMNNNFGEYPYKQFSFIQAGDGGMEYPMSTLMLGNGKNVEGMVGLAVHETLHSWYHGVLGTNEQKYPWMDEGFTTWAENLTMAHLYERLSEKPHKRTYRGYLSLQKSGDKEPLSTKADFFKTNFNYGQSSYSKGAVFLAQLAYIIGEDNLRITMLRYFNEWKFKHPTSNDFKRIAEKVSGMQLQWYFDKWILTNQKIDYAIKSVVGKGNNTNIVLSKIGDIPMPLDITIILDNDDVKSYYIPLRMMRGIKKNESGYKRDVLNSWPWVYPEYSFMVNIPKDKIKFIAIDVSERMADVKKSNNYYPKKEDIFRGN